MNSHCHREATDLLVRREGVKNKRGKTVSGSKKSTSFIERQHCLTYDAKNEPVSLSKEGTLHQKRNSFFLVIKAEIEH